MLLESKVVARDTVSGNAAIYFLRARVNNVASVVSIQYTSSEESEDVPAWDASYAVSGTNIVIQVTGDAVNNVNWKSTTFTESV